MADRDTPTTPWIEQTARGLAYRCGHCKTLLWEQMDSATFVDNVARHRYCSFCGRPVEMIVTYSKTYNI